MRRKMRACMTADSVTRFARVDFRSDERVFGIKDEDRFLHLYIIGKTGTGKMTTGMMSPMSGHPISFELTFALD